MTLVERNYDKDPKDSVEYKPTVEPTESTKREIGWRGLQAVMTTPGEIGERELPHKDNENILLGYQ